MKTKLHFNTDLQELYKSEGGHLLQLVCDPGVHQVKSSSSSVFSKSELAKYAPDKDHFMMHCIAQGNYETYGENDNNDGWPKKANQERFNTFVTHGHMYDEHRHKDKSLSTGLIKAAKYNDDQGRIELILWGNIKKAAAVYDKLKRNERVDFSMSARVPHDRCLACGNLSRTSRDYCECISKSPRQYIEKHANYAVAMNDKPTYFDISTVKTPALRIASYLQHKFPDNTELVKAASVANPPLITGAEWAEFAGVDLSDVPAASKPIIGIRKQAALQKLTNMERRLQEVTRTNPSAALHATASCSRTWHDDLIAKATKLQPGTWMRKLASKGVVMPFDVFTAWLNNSSISDVQASPMFKSACMLLPSLFSTLQNEGCSCGCDETNLEDAFDASPFSMASLDDRQNSDGIDALLEDVGEDAMHYVHTDDEHNAPARATITIIKFANANPQVFASKVIDSDLTNASPAAKELAHVYGLYKLATLCDMQMYHNEKHLNKLLPSFIYQNYAAVI